MRGVHRVSSHHVLVQDESRGGDLEKIYQGEGCMTGSECWLSIVLMLIVPVSALLYLVAHVYWTTESFLNLANMEESTFVVPNRLQYKVQKVFA
jgi:hypothetical protein